MTKLREPSELELSIGDLALVLKDVKYGSARISLLIKRFYVDQQTASYWVKLVRDYEQERQAS